MIKMNKLPVKQVYLLSVIVIGIITLSVYSTYSIFTLESETSDIVNIEIANVLNIESNNYEYKQVVVSPKSSITTDVDIYNNYNYDICYAIWYKVVPSEEINTSNVSVRPKEDEASNTSGSLKEVTGRRISLVIENNNDVLAKVNIGIAYAKNEETCELNISKDKNIISSSIDDTKILSDTIIKSDKIKKSEGNYITYKDNTNSLTLPLNDKIYISTKYTYKEEIFTLTDSLEIDADDILKYVDNNTDYYTCISNTECRYLYHIKEITKDNNNYNITKYDTLIGYLSGDSGIRKVNQNYYYYGDNPDNFIYFNCTDELDTKTCELWRIIGVFYDKDSNKYITKIIKNNSLTLSKYGNDNTWKDSKILKLLNEYKINNEDMIQEIDYKIENLTDLNTNINDIPLLKDTYKSNIMLMNLSDFLNTSTCQDKKISEYKDECLNNNWLNNNYPNEEWTMTIKYEEPYVNDDNETIIPNNNKVYSIGKSINLSSSTSTLNIRSVVYLKNNITIVDGDGSYEKPYIIK